MVSSILELGLVVKVYNMRKKIVAGNWKMNLSFDEARSLFHELSRLDYDDKMVDMVLAPPAIYISQFAFANSTEIELAAQNCHHEDSGAFTGEWSAKMLSSLRVSHCLVGHSERRAMFQETNEIVSEKAMKCFENGIAPILCCGESLQERESGDHFDIVSAQIDAVLSRLEDHQARKLVIAYEPVWAIGTGVTASSEQAQEMHQFLRKLVQLQFDSSVSDSVRILYGGSVKPANAAELFSMPDVDGGLVGGAALDYPSFKSILEAAS
jgi:triosephosphate isomerase